MPLFPAIALETGSMNLVYTVGVGGCDFLNLISHSFIHLICLASPMRKGEGGFLQLVLMPRFDQT